jgi:hypothetical protein
MAIIKAFQIKLWLWETQTTNKNLAHFEVCIPFNLHKSNPWFNCYSGNTGLLRTKFEYLLQDFKLCEINCAVFTAPCNFEAYKADIRNRNVGVQVRCNLVLKEKFKAVEAPTYFMHNDLQKLLNLLAKYVQCLTVHICTNICFHSWHNTRAPKKIMINRHKFIMNNESGMKAEF